MCPKQALITSGSTCQTRIFLKKAITIYINTRFYLTVNKESDVAIDDAEPFERLLNGNVYCIFLFYKVLFLLRTMQRVKVEMKEFLICLYLPFKIVYFIINGKAFFTSHTYILKK